MTDHGGTMTSVLRTRATIFSAVVAGGDTYTFAPHTPEADARRLFRHAREGYVGLHILHRAL